MSDRRARILLCFSASWLLAAQSKVWLDVPFVKQQKNGCGAASIAMVMLYWKQQLPSQPPPPGMEEIQRALYSPWARGIYTSDAEWYLQQHGFRTFALRGEWTDLEQHLEKGRPLIVALGSGRNLHFVVVTGLDTEQNMILKHDPTARGWLRQRRSEFEKEWMVARNWTLLAVPEQYSDSLSH
jgi:ABC-type bacteriocin/lantibiotic exporter with double-glycine peptidase domain